MATSGGLGRKGRPRHLELAPWKKETGVDAVVDRWLASKVVRPCLAADATIAARDAKTAPLPADLDPGIVRALAKRGITELYTHQAAAYEAARTARGVVVATPTASGKSLCFHLPILQRLAHEPDARAMYLFPTKALARDQESALRELVDAAGLGAASTGGRAPISAVVFDGDTPADARRAARERSGIVITNPDMLHTGILPHHTAWARTLQNLRYVVVDEMHTYKGVFGSHVANVLRRLLRAAEFHGSRPQLLGATATIGNPKEHAARLFGLDEDEIALVDESGAPNGARRFFLYNPPVVNAELGIRASYVKQAVMLAADLVRANVPTIVFGQSRNNVEMMLKYLRERVAPGDARGGGDGRGDNGKDTSGIDKDRILGYRGGYLPETRRDIERRLRSGEVLAVVATNALELGIDIGELDAVVCAGYPGSIAGTWQRFGRAGRRGGTSLCVLVTSSAPLDQYLAREPKFLLGTPVEEARIDPENVEVLIQHLKCAAFELPFKRGEAFGQLPADDTGDALGFLAQHKVLHEARGTFHWAADAYPANNVSLRSIGWDNVVIIDAEHDRTIAEIDWRGSHTMLHEQAIYQHDAETWQVERFDYENHKAYVRKVAPDYFTDAMTYTQVSVLEENARGALVPLPAGAAASPGGWDAGWGEVAVVEKVVGYKKIKFHTHENAGYGDVRLPEMQMHTTAFWLKVPEATCAAIAGDRGRAAVIDGLRGVGLALETVSTLALMCDPRDLAMTLGDTATDGKPDGDRDHDADRDGERDDDALPNVPRRVRGGPQAGYDPTLFLYEHVPGGTGLAERIYAQRDVLLARALRLVDGCPCEVGCPACVGPSDAMALTRAGVDARCHSRKGIAVDLIRAALPTA